MSSTDIELLTRWTASGDAVAFNELMTKHAGHVYGTCKRILRTDADAQEAAQECFLRLAESRPEIKTSLAAWLHTVATNVACSRVRSDQRRQERERKFAQQVPANVEPEWDDISELVDEAIESLPDELRTAVIDSFFEKRTHEAIAKAGGVDRSTITRRIDRGIEKIRDHLRNRGVPVNSVVLPGLFTDHLKTKAPESLHLALSKIALSGRRSSAASHAAGNKPLQIAAEAVFGGGVLGKWVFASVVAVVAAGSIWFAASRSSDPASTDGDSMQAEVHDSPFSNSESSSVAETIGQEPSADEGPAAMDTVDTPIDVATGDDQSATSGSISGIVTTKPEGVPVPDATVTLRPVGSPNTQTQESTTDEDGRYEFASLAFGEYQLNVGEVEGYLAKDGSVTERRVPLTESRPESQGVNFLLSQGGILIGRVVSMEEPLANQALTLMTYDDSHGDETYSIPGTFVTDDDGMFRASGIRPFKGTIFALRERPEGSLQETLPVVADIGPDRIERVTFDFIAGTSSISGTAYLGNKDNPIRSLIELHYFWPGNDGQGEESFRVWTGDDGYFLMEDLPAGKVSITVNPIDGGVGGTQHDTFVLGEGEHVVHDVVLTEHTLEYRCVNLPDWAKELTVVVHPGRFNPNIGSFQDLGAARQSAAMAARHTTLSRSEYIRPLQGLPSGDYTVTASLWPTHYNIATIVEFGVDRFFENAVHFSQFITIAPGNSYDQVVFDFSAIAEE